MKPTIISNKATNWVDQGLPPHRVMRRVLSFFLGRRESADIAWLDDQTNTIVGMVAADANEVEVANYLRSLAPDESRDAAERVLQGEVPVNAPTPDTLGHWVASRLLTAHELTEFESSTKSRDEADDVKVRSVDGDGAHFGSE